jgi:tRNA A37 threonylcarbamoyladenosine synthetase subunit TsaC/SUA5/YrdC
MAYENKDQYKQIAFRVAHTDSQDEILEQEWPLFLTSANISGKSENYTLEDLKNTFWNKLNKDIEIIDEVDLEQNIAPSDIFSFVWDTLEINYLRKN